MISTVVTKWYLNNKALIYELTLFAGDISSRRIQRPTSTVTMGSESRYTTIAHSAADRCVHCDDNYQDIAPLQRKRSSSVVWKALCFLLLGLNAVLLYRQYHHTAEVHHDGHPGEPHRVVRRRPVLIRLHPAATQQSVTRTGWTGGPYVSTNRTVQDAAWSDAKMQPFHGFVALSDEYSKRLGLPESWRWPWDKSKGMYQLAASHAMHCVLVLRKHVNQLQDGIAAEHQSYSYPHILHCLDALRETVMCDADPQPLEFSYVDDGTGGRRTLLGASTTRSCRSWEDMLDWANSNSACYRPEVEHSLEGDTLNYYKFCPDGSQPWAKDS
ncbi:hypothetical protein K461DRAFT_316047 [Myriangium duriaei CBS 260.36]|uniref:Uncharacterized protein n=1 Tax=Myriangium duriaei CBS 260.36 TaxID=1168546 RepID=A0A9P4IYG9_9PEZI|nr:hypothetical protein K461DRAFT_316047 [Myriangium duriaei CBS 260.36]